MQAHPHLRENQDFYLVKNGVRRSAMPAGRNIMADSEIRQVVTFLNHLDDLPPSVQQELYGPRGQQSVSRFWGLVHDRK